MVSVCNSQQVLTLQESPDSFGKMSGRIYRETGEKNVCSYNISNKMLDNIKCKCKNE